MEREKSSLLCVTRALTLETGEVAVFLWYREVIFCDTAVRENIAASMEGKGRFLFPRGSREYGPFGLKRVWRGLLGTFP